MKRPRTNGTDATPPLGLWTTMALVVASMVGAGVFTSSGYALKDLGSPERVLAAWAIGGLIAIAGAISYGALAQRIAESGGEYVFLARRVHPLAGFLAGWVSLVAGFTAAMAFAATALEAYALPLTGLDALPRGVFASVVVLLAAVLHTLGTAPGARWQAGVVVAKVVGLVLLVIGGLVALAARGPLPPASREVPPFDIIAFANSLVWISLAYAGFNAAVYVAEEVRDPRRTIPRAMIVATLLVALLYLALNGVMVYAGPHDQLAGQPDVAAVAARLLGGLWGELACRGLIIVALLTSVSALTMSGPRVYAKMAHDGLFPLPKEDLREAPVLAIWLQALLACVVALSTTLLQQLNYLSFMLSVCSAATVATLFLPHRGQRLRAHEALAAGLFVVASFTFAALAAKQEGNPAAIATAATLALGLVAYVLMRWWRPAEKGR